jgi:hypothetical protein
VLLSGTLDLFPGSFFILLFSSSSSWMSRSDFFLSEGSLAGGFPLTTLDHGDAFVATSFFGCCELTFSFTGAAGLLCPLDNFKSANLELIF